MAERPQAEHLTPAERTEQLRRVRTVNRGGAVLAAAGMVGLGALAAISFPGTSTTAAGNDTTTGAASTPEPTPAATTAPTSDTSGSTGATSSSGGTSTATPTPAATPTLT